MKHLLWLAVLAACTDFESIDRDVCGNGLLEAGEDCDSDDPSCVSCAVACTTDDQCPSSAYRCGVDGVCHAPGGVLGELRTAGAFQADDLHVTDIDHDGIGDALGVSRTSLLVRHGDPAGQLDQFESILTPTQTGPAAVGDLDGDGSLDLALTTPDGLVSYTSQYGTIAPVAINEQLLEGNAAIDIRMMLYIAPSVLAILAVDSQTDVAAIFTIDGNSTPEARALKRHEQIGDPCAARLGRPVKGSEIDASTIDVYNVNTVADGRIDTVLSIPLNGAYCVLSIHRDAPNLFAGPAAFPIFTFKDITPTAAGFGVPSRRPVLADLEDDADTCPGIVRWDAGLNQLEYWDGVLTSSECAFSTTKTALPPLRSQAPSTTERLVGRAPVSPSVALVAADGLVTSESLFPYLPAGIPIFSPSPTFVEVYRTTRRIARIAHGDVDGDDAVDLVFAAEGEANLDLLLRVPDEAGFNLVRLDTASTVTNLVVADFDANRIQDIAYTEVSDEHERLLVSFGTTDRPLEPVVTGVFSSVIALSRLSVPDSVDYLNLADDIAVLQPPAPTQAAKRLALLHGSPQRTLISYFDPRVSSAVNETLFRGSVIGHFVASSANVETELTDLVAIAPQSRATTGPPRVRHWRIPGMPLGLDGTKTEGVDLQGIADCSTTDTTSLCLQAARYLAFPTAENHDVVIGVDNDGHAIKLDPWSAANPVATTALTALTSMIPGGAVARSLHAADLDGDGSTDLLATFAGDTSAVLACSMSDGVPQACVDLVPRIRAVAEALAPSIPVTECIAATVAQMSYRDASAAPAPGADIVVACRGSGTTLFAVRRTAEGDEVRLLTTVAESVSSLHAGDVTGDGVDDLVLLDGDALRSLLVLPQCTNRDLACLENR